MFADAFNDGGTRLPTRLQRTLCLDCQRTFIFSLKGPRYDLKFRD